MAESSDAILDMEDVDSSGEGPIVGGDLGDDMEESGSDSDDDDEQQLASSTFRPWSFESYQGFFDVDTDQVLSRIWRSFIPRSSFMAAVNGKPDLYGPFWICMTLALSITMSGNIASYLANPSGYSWQYDFRHLTFAITAIYSYVWILPALLWAWLWWRGVKGKTSTLLALICVYGYSLAIFVPSSFIFSIFRQGSVHWVLVMVSMTLSGAVLFRTFWPIIKKKDKKLAVATITVILLIHAALSVGCKMYFFSRPSQDSKAISPTTVPPMAEMVAAASGKHSVPLGGNLSRNASKPLSTGIKLPLNKLVQSHPDGDRIKGKRKKPKGLGNVVNTNIAGKKQNMT